MRSIGRPLKRLEDRPLLTGKGRFAADFNAAGQLYMRVVRSPVAFGRITAIETEDAAALPGVVAVWTGEDVADIPPIDFRMTRIEGMPPYRQRILAQGYVRYVGDPVAVVFAESAYVAEDAADLVFCDIEELDPHLDATLDPVPFPLDEVDGLTSEPAVVEKSYGDLAAAFARADHTVELEVRVGRHSGVPLEARGALAAVDPGSGVLTLYGAAKVPHYNRDAIARMLNLAPGRIELSEGHVGGGFGIRGELYPEDVLVCAAALRLGRPVKWVEDRKEHLIAANHSRDQVHRVRAAVRADGFVLGIDDEFFTDQGAYVRSHGGTVTDLAAALMPGPYIVPAYRARGRIRLTNKTPAGTYRAPGRYESTFARERLMDAIAHRLGLDPLEVRRANLIPEASMPFDRGIDALGTHVIYDSGKYHDLLDRLAAHVDLPAMRVDVAARRDRGEKAGIGIAFFVEKSGLGPLDKVRLTLGPDGTAEIVTGVASVGQGVETVMAQICAETLDLPIESIRVIHGQTVLIDVGFGAFASRVTVMTGSAVQIAAQAMRDNLLRVAGSLLQADPSGLSLADGKVTAASGASIGIADLAGQMPAGDRVAEGEFRTEHMNYPYGIHLAQIRVDAETCGIEVERYVVAVDIGRMVNPMLVEGQIAGAAAQGIGGALLEEFVYDDYGQPLSTSFADYLMPTAAEVPAIECLVREDAPSPQNPLGVKGAGEGGITAAGAAIAAAIDDALRMPGAIDRLPVTPARLHRLLVPTSGRD